MPFLLPPPDFGPGELSELGLTGTCELQIVRSAGAWSMGLSKTEHSIQNAYLKGHLPSVGQRLSNSWSFSYPDVRAFRLH